MVQHHIEEFVRQFKWALTSREVFRWLSDTPVHTLTDIQRAARFYYLQQNCFGGRVEGRTFGTATTSPPGLNLLRIEETLSAADLRLSGAYIEKAGLARLRLSLRSAPHFLLPRPPLLGNRGLRLAV